MLLLSRETSFFFLKKFNFNNLHKNQFMKLTNSHDFKNELEKLGDRLCISAIDELSPSAPGVEVKIHPMPTLVSANSLTSHKLFSKVQSHTLSILLLELLLGNSVVNAPSCSSALWAPLSSLSLRSYSCSQSMENAVW